MCRTSTDARRTNPFNAATERTVVTSIPRSAFRRLTEERADLFTRFRASGLIDAEHRIVGRDGLEVGNCRIVRHGEMVATTCGHLRPCLEDRGALVEGNLREQNRV
jgi:hypothetical protein